MSSMRNEKREQDNRIDDSPDEYEADMEVYQGRDVWDLVKRLEAEKRRDPRAAIRLAQIWLQELLIGEVVNHVEQWYQQSHGKEQSELFKYLRHYRYLADQKPTLHPFAYPYYWATFTCIGV